MEIIKEQFFSFFLGKNDKIISIDIKTNEHVKH